MKTWMWIGPLAAAVCAATPPRVFADDDDASLRALSRLERAEPEVQDAVAAAVRFAGLGGRPEARMKRRARLAAALPTLSLKAGRDTVWNESDDTARVIGDVKQEVVIEARATWRLDRLMFDDTELRVASLAQQRAKARAAVAAQTTSLYYKRRAAQVEALWHPPDTIEESVRRELALEELTAQLDALTGGWWVQQTAE